MNDQTADARLRELMANAPGTDAAKSRAAGMNNRDEWRQYKIGLRVPGLKKTAEILAAINKRFADLDGSTESP